MDAALRAGVAIYNAGHYHDAHDAWEDRWLDLEAGTDDERLLHGLIQFTAAVFHAGNGNWDGVGGLAERAVGYLGGLPADYRGVNVGTVRDYLGRAAADPHHVERVAPPALTYEGRALGLDDLDVPALGVAATVFAEADEAYDAGVVERAAAFAEAAVDAAAAATATGDDRFVALVTDFVVDEGRRPLVYDRLRAHVERRVAELEDAAGLFD